MVLPTSTVSWIRRSEGDRPGNPFRGWSCCGGGGEHKILLCTVLGTQAGRDGVPGGPGVGPWVNFNIVYRATVGQ